VTKLVVHFTDTQEYNQRTIGERMVQYDNLEEMKKRGKEISNNGFWYDVGDRREVFIPASNVHKVEIKQEE